jgi:hypothetical protein
MRKRHAARPTLEPVEDRLVLSAASSLDPTAHARAALAGLLAQHSHATPAKAAHHATTHAGKAEAGKAHQHRASTAHPPQHKSSSSSSSSNIFSNFFKSLGL